MMIHTQHQNSRTSILPPNFAAAAEKPARQSLVQRLCADYTRKFGAFNGRLDAHYENEREAKAAEPAMPAVLRPNKRNRSVLPAWMTIGFVIRSNQILSAIKGITENNVKREGSHDNLPMVITMTKEPLPPSAKDKARLSRLQTMLQVAQKYEAQCDAIQKRFRVQQSEDFALELNDDLLRIGRRIAKTPSKSIEDVAAKARVYALDPGNEPMADIALSLAADLARLAPLKN